MKKIVALFLVCLMCLPNVSVQAKAFDNDMRAVWIATVYNLDYPSTKNNITAQQRQFVEMLDEMNAIGINTVFVQVRPKADALYKSAINPWSDVLTGHQGKNPGYDPLAFMVEATHNKGMEIHAWMNPYRVTTSGTDLTTLSSGHPARMNPNWVFSYDNALYYNPELEAVKQHIVDSVKEIVTNYDVDGIHFDDYFYPSDYPLPTGETKDGKVANARREAINDMIKRVNQAIKTVNSQKNKSVQFGISPPGIWKNIASDATGSNTDGREAYYSLFADTRAWIKNGWIDYIAPQIYWKIGHNKANYSELVKWWVNEVKGTNVKLYIGQGIYLDDVAKEITKELKLNQQYPEIKGSIYFSIKDLLNNKQNCRTEISKFYKQLGNKNTSTTNTTTNNTTTNNTTNNSATTNNTTTTSTNAVAGKIGVVNVNGLNIREGAKADRPIVKEVNNGTKVTILDTLNGWYKVKLADGTTGWASSQFITVTDETLKPPTYPREGTVNVETLNVREGARTDRPIVETITKGTKVTLLADLNGWYKIKLADGKIGWASQEFIDG